MKVWLPLVALAAACCAPQAASACSIALDNEMLFADGNPFESGIPAAERDRRMVGYREWLAGLPEAQRRDWASDALVWTGYDYMRQAQIVVDALLPPVVTVAGGGPCTYMGPFPAPGDALYDAVSMALVTAPSVPTPPLDGATLATGDIPILVTATFVPSLEFPQHYASIVARCSAETRDLVAADLLDRVGEYAVSDVLGELTGHGYAQGTAFRDSLRDPVLRFADAGRTQLTLGTMHVPVRSTGGYGYPGVDEQHEQIAAQAWEEISAYLQADPQALAVIAAIEASLAERYDPNAPFNGYCPAVAAQVRTLVLDQFDRRRLVIPDEVGALLGS